MDKTQIAVILEEIGTILELQGENRFRTQAYHNAARALHQLEESLPDLIASGRLVEVPGIGKTLAEKITELHATGNLPFYEELRRQMPGGLLHLLRLPGLGPRKARLLFDQLQIDSLEALKQACLDDRIATLKGFGAKTQQKLLEGIEFLDRTGQRVRLDQAEFLAEALLDQLRRAPGIVRCALCGSLRRRKETINDIDILVSSELPGPIMKCFTRLLGVAQVTGKGETKSSIVVNGVAFGGPAIQLPADLRVVRDSQFPFALHYFTGSKEHNVAVRARAQQLGLKLNEYELAGAGGPVACAEEADIFRALGLDFIPPELREHTGELEAAATHELPCLVERADLRGTFHCHSTWSDGKATLEDMVLAARQRGLEYLGIADHSQSLTIANGLSPERVRRQQEEADAVAARVTGIRIFKGTECDILPDGTLDFDDQLLSTFEYVVASVHSHFNQTEEEMTERIVRAIQHPAVTMLGHPTGRLLLRRDGYRVNLETVLRAAAESGTMIEINAHPPRLDLDWVHCKRAKALGVKLVINPDAHDTRDLDYLRLGVDVARRGWLEKKDVFNTLTADEVAQVLRQ